MMKNKKLFISMFILPLLLTAGCSYDKGNTFINELLEGKVGTQESDDESSTWDAVSKGDSDESNTASSLVTFNEAEEAQVADNYYYTQLSEENQLIYRQIVYGIENHQYRIPVETTDPDIPHTIFYAVLMDYPEYFWLSGESTVWEMYNGSFYKLELGYNMEKEEIDSYQQQIDSAVNEFLTYIPEESDTYTKVKLTYEWIINNTEYLENDNDQNIQSVLIQNESVCAGYAKTFQYLMNELEIPCIYVEGYAEGEPHAWNIVDIDGVYTNVDCTWGEPYFEGEEDDYPETVIYDYLCITTEELSRTHTPEEQYTYPDCTDQAYDYYLLNNYYFNIYDENAIVQAGWDTINAGKEQTSMKFSNKESFHQALNLLDEGGKLEDVAYQKMEWEGLDEYGYSYYYDDDLYTIKIFW